MDVRATLKNHGWQQGALICSSSFELSELKPPHVSISETDLLLVITQTCDLINPSFEKEPVFEVLLLKRRLSQADRRCKDGQNPREIHMDIEYEECAGLYVAKPFERFFIDRTTIKSLTPMYFLSDAQRVTVVDWLAKRYKRIAFPDEFDSRWKPRKEKIKKIMHNELAMVKGVYLKIIPFKELSTEEEYKLEVILLMESTDFDNCELYEKCKRNGQKLEDEFNNCDGIGLQSIGPVSIAEISVEEFQDLVLWDYSYISYRTSDTHVQPVEI